MDVRAGAADRVWEPTHRALATGLLLTVTMIAFEALGVSTAMPVVSKDLHGLSLYGWAFSATTLASLLGIAVSGRQVDIHGPGPPFAVGLAFFSAGLVIAGAAPSMPILVAGRFAQGLGAGVLPPVVYASIGRAFTDSARARMFALLSTAWILPGIAGPALSGAVAVEFGWRWVFLGILPLVPLNALLALPALSRLGPPSVVGPAKAAVERVPPRGLVAAQLAAGAGLFIAGLSQPVLVAIPLVLAGGALALPALHKLVPPGTLRASPGLPTAVAARGLQTFCFFGAQAFITLALTTLRGVSVTGAGLVLTATSLSWTAGSWVQERRWRTWGRRKLVGAGLALVAAGTGGLSLIVLPVVPLAVPVLAWVVAGLGMGMAYGGISMVVLAEAEPGQEGSATSAMQLSDVLGVALGTGIGGAAVAVGEALGWHARSGLAIAFALAVVAGAIGAAISTRLPH